jgi:ABC-type dipeptide/oligopeptide/nickel transport system permease subunit
MSEISPGAASAGSGGRGATFGPLFYLSLFLLAILLLVAAAAPVLAPQDPTTQDLGERFLPPGTADHLLGTDDFGRDVLSRIMYGAQSALLVGLIAVSVALVIGVLIGLIAGLAEGVPGNTLMLIMDGVLSFPTVLLAITVVSVFGYGLVQVMLALGVIFSPLFARTVRAETLSIKAEAYVESSRALGSPLWKTVVLHVLPNMLPKVIVLASTTFALSVAIEASLSYLGLGTQPPEPSWGLMLKDARNYLTRAPWLAIYPGLAIALTVFSFNVIGDTLSEHLNPALRRK